MKHWKVCAAALLVGAGMCLAQTTQGDLQKQVTQLAAKLDADDAAVRRAAEIALGKLPPEAVPMLDALAREEKTTYIQQGVLRAVAEDLRPKYAPIRAAERQAAASAAARRDYLESYRTLGKKDPKWDGLFEKAVAAAYPPGKERRNPQAAREYLQQAIDAGCDDPSVLRLAAVAEKELHPGSAEYGRLIADAWNGMRGLPYPPARKFMTMAWVIETVDDQPGVYGRPEHLEREKEFFDLYEAGMATPGLLEQNAQLMYSAAFDRVWAWSGSKETAYERAYPMLEKYFSKSPVAGYSKGLYFNNYAWDARGGDTIDKVSAEDFKKFQDRLGVAQAALEAAYEMDPSDTVAASVMVSVASTLENPDEPMETWFKRAMAADPGNVRACQTKLHYLLPRWNGSHEAMRKFGLECATNNPDYSTGIPFMLMEAHLAISNDEGMDPDTYFDDREIWEELKGLYEAALKAKPGNQAFLCAYGHAAVLCQKWKEADALFKQVQEEQGIKFFKEESQYRYELRKVARRLADTPAEK